jgi:hypothetical protein
LVYKAWSRPSVGPSSLNTPAERGMHLNDAPLLLLEYPVQAVRIKASL